MLDIKPDFTNLAHRLQHERALARAESKVGAPAHSGLAEAALGAEGSDGPPLADAELVQLHIRVIALENLVIAMLARGSDQQLCRGRPNFDHPCRLNIDQGWKAASSAAVCG